MKLSRAPQFAAAPAPPSPSYLLGVGAIAGMVGLLAVVALTWLVMNALQR